MSNFVDECNLNVRGGDGGAGCVSFRREAHVAKGGPDGGDGGKGGSVWLVADHNSASLLSFRDHPHRRAGNGTHGSGKKRHGRSADDLEVAVPEGTTVYDFDGNLLADLVTDGDRWLAAEGGNGGQGNARFLSNKRRAPAFAEQGEEGEERWLRLELKLVADVALVGFPNVGKSTLISRISAAKPKIADYPFTTLEPNLGVVGLSEGRSFVLADIPGIIEGAHAGKGLGDTFLQHVERTRVLAYLVPVDVEDPQEHYDMLRDEASKFDASLAEKAHIVALTKSDLLGPEESPSSLSAPEAKAVLTISSATNRNLDELKECLWKLLIEEEKKIAQSESIE